MKLSFKQLDIENFMSIGKMSLDISSLTGFNTIVGENNRAEDNAKSNGSGKSSIFEALIWCLTGETIRGNKDVVNHNTTGGTSVSVCFESDGKTYSISRYKNHSEFKTNLFIYVDGEDKSGKGIRDSEKLLESYLPELTASLIGSVIVLGQGLPSRFTNNTPSARKEVLEKLTQSDFMIEDIRTHVAERKDYLSSTLRECQDNKISCSTMLATARNSRKVLEDKLNSLGDVQSKKDKLQEHFETLAGLKQCVIKYSADYSEADEQVRYTQDDYNSLESSQNNELLVIKNEYAERSGVVQADIAALNATINALQRNISNAKKVTDVCPTCGQKLPGVYVPNTQEDEEELARLQDKVKELSCKQQQLYEEYNVLKWTEVEAKYKSKLHEIRDMLMSQLARRTEANNLKEKTEQAIKTGELEVIRIQTEIEHHEAIKKDTITEIEKCDESILHLELQYKGLEEEETSINQHIAVINKFETIIKRDFRGYLLQDIIVYIDKRAKEYSKVIFGTELIDFALDGNNISISYNGKSYEALSGGERQKVDIIVQFAIRDVLCAYTNFHTNIIVLDEIFDNLDEVGSRRVIDLISHQLTDISAIFIISHHAKELNLPYDRELVVRKDENGVSNLV